MKKIPQSFSRVVLFACIIILSSCNNDDRGNTITNAENKQPVGSSARDFLSNDNFTNLDIEIVFVDNNTAPNQNSINALRDFIEERTFKTNININQRTITPPSVTSYSVNDVINLEDTNRTSFNTDNTLSLFIFYANRESSGDQGVNAILGTAYRNTSFVMFKPTINAIGSQPNNPSAEIVETSVILHEMAHLFGLVDNGTPLQSDHVDPSSTSHCNVAGCLMLSNLEFGDGMTDMQGVPELDPLCVADLQANGGR
ncbi:MAG: membrane metalloprotease [Flavobacteriaceae bacterium]|nr:membrane metalloprotease [Flavobacteriaceae bacterium]